MSRSTPNTEDDLYKPRRGSIIDAVVQHIKEEDEGFVEEKEAEIAFRQAEMETVEKVLEIIDRSAEKRIKEGFSNVNFTIGVLNCFLVCVVFVRYPQHFWLLYFTEAIYLVPMGAFYNWRAKPLNQVLYYCDYCWVMNILVITVLISATSLPSFSWEARKQIFMTAAGTSAGTLTGACLVLPFVAVVFHDARTMTGVLIHLLPTMVTYTFLWHRTAIHQAWPGIFPFEFHFDEMPFFPGDNKPALILPGTGLSSVSGNAVALYFVWWILYVIWMIVLGGINLPRKDRAKPPKFDTVFHSTVRHGLAVAIGKVFWGRPVAVSLQQQEADHYEVRDFFVYMAGHATMCYFGGIMVLANLCWHYRQAHLVVIVLLTVVAVYRGAERYTYYATSMSSRSIRKEFKDILPPAEETKKGKKQH